jgi:hypothetical protein
VVQPVGDCPLSDSPLHGPSTCFEPRRGLGNRFRNEEKKWMYMSWLHCSVCSWIWTCLDPSSQAEAKQSGRLAGSRSNHDTAPQFTSFPCNSAKSHLLSPSPRNSGCWRRAAALLMESQTHSPRPMLHSSIPDTAGCLHKSLYSDPFDRHSELMRSPWDIPFLHEYSLSITTTYPSNSNRRYHCWRIPLFEEADFEANRKKHSCLSLPNICGSFWI